MTWCLSAIRKFFTHAKGVHEHMHELTSRATQHLDNQKQEGDKLLAELRKLEATVDQHGREHRKERDQ
jgi:hypothetical protein